VWPELTAPALLSRLYADGEFLRRCAPNLTEDERGALARPAPRNPRAARWTAADAVLLDELAGMIEGGDTYLHVVVDEAQDLSPMQCRAVARRCPLGSVTVLGDLAQATTPWAPGDWAQTLAHLGKHAEVRPLTAGYRVPGEVLALANRLLPHIATGVPPATSVRTGEDALRFLPASSLVDEVARDLEVPGSIGVIVPDALVETTLARLAPFGAVRLDDDADERVTVVPAGEAKGLEYDSVLVVEPEQIVSAEPTRPAGLRRLYVVLTRAVSRLTVLHDEQLPAELG
jgi:DNA helicase IV